MSTTLLIGRSPTARSRCRSHPGDGPTTMPSITRASKRGQPAGSSTRTWARSSADVAERNSSGTPTGGSLSVSPSAAASSRAIPTWQRQSGRLVVMSRSSTVSRGSTSASGCPGRPSSRMRMPSASSPTPSSIAEQSIPGDLCPRMVFTPNRSSSAGGACPGWGVRDEWPVFTLGRPGEHSHGAWHDAECGERRRQTRRRDRGRRIAGATSPEPARAPRSAPPPAPRRRYRLPQPRSRCRRAPSTMVATGASSVA